MAKSLAAPHWLRAGRRAVLEELGETARLACFVRNAAPLDETQIDALRRRFGACW